MEKFLETYSNVPNKFIENFFNISQIENYSSNSFIIELDIVSQWLGVQKGHLKRLLVRNFEKDYDFIVKNGYSEHNTGKFGSSYTEHIILTPDCFKELCMLSRTQRAKEVRKYYISIEKLVQKYYRHIQDDLETHIGLLENNQRPKYNIKGGVIYIMAANNQGPASRRENKSYYKLGKAKELDDRLSSYNTGMANDVKPLFILKVDNIKKVENCIKNLVSEYRYRRNREIFEIDLDLLKDACHRCDELVAGLDLDYHKSKTEFSQKVKVMNDKSNQIYLHIQKNNPSMHK